MLNINFVPDDYVQNSELRKTNLMYLAMFVVVMAALGGSFAAIKIQQRALSTKEKLINVKMAQAQEAIKQFEELRAKRKAMMKTALTTAELLEPVPRSVLLALLTNNLPTGTSLLRLKFIQKESKTTGNAAAAGKYKSPQTEKAASDDEKMFPEKLLETYIDIEGIAPSDIQVAVYIERLSNSTLLDNVALVESKEHKIGAGSQTQSNKPSNSDVTIRQFKLTAMLKKNIHTTKEDVKKIAYGASADR